MGVELERTFPRTGDHQEERTYAAVAAVSSLVAAVIHAMVVPEHLVESVAAGTFFAVLALAQLALTVCLLRPLPLPVTIVAGALLGHVGVIGLYVASRTMALGFVPAHRPEHLPVAGGVGNGIPEYPFASVEPVGVLDMACLSAELVLVMMLAALLPTRVRGHLTTVLALCSAGAVVARVLGAPG